jgi:magnesium-transporting ATPase (P-type)
MTVQDPKKKNLEKKGFASWIFILFSMIFFALFLVYGLHDKKIKNPALLTCTQLFKVTVTLITFSYFCFLLLSSSSTPLGTFSRAHTQTHAQSCSWTYQPFYKKPGLHNPPSPLTAPLSCQRSRRNNDSNNTTISNNKDNSNNTTS